MRGRHADHLEEVAGDVGHLHHAGRACAAYHAFPRGVAGHPHRSETAVPLVDPVEPYARLRTALRVHRGDRDQPVRGRVRQRPPEHAPGDGEHRGVDAQAQGQDADDQRGRSRLANQQAGGVPHVVEDRLEHRDRRLILQRLPELGARPAAAGRPDGVGPADGESTLTRSAPNSCPGQHSPVDSRPPTTPSATPVIAVNVAPPYPIQRRTAPPPRGPRLPERAMRDVSMEPRLQCINIAGLPRNFRGGGRTTATSLRSLPATAALAPFSINPAVHRPAPTQPAAPSTAPRPRPQPAGSPPVAPPAPRRSSRPLAATTVDALNGALPYSWSSGEVAGNNR